MEHIPMTPNNMNLAIRVLQKVLKLKFFFMSADLYSWIIDFTNGQIHIIGCHWDVFHLHLVHSMNFVLVKCMTPQKTKKLHEMDGTHPNDTK